MGTGWIRWTMVVCGLSFAAGCADSGHEENPSESFTADDLPGEESDAPLDASDWQAYADENVPITAWDADRSGGIDPAELDAARATGVTSDTTFGRWDRDQSGVLDGSEWSGAWFEMHDDNRDGIIQRSELSNERFRRATPAPGA